MTFSKTALSFFLLTIFSSALPVFAESNSGLFRQVRQEERQEHKQEIQTGRQELRGTITQDKLAQKRLNAQNIAKRIRLQLTQRFDYLNKIKARLSTRITEIETANATAEKKRDMTAAKAKLASFDITKYNLDLGEFDKLVATIATAEKPQSMIPALRASAKNVQTDLKALHQNLVDTLKLIVKAR